MRVLVTCGAVLEVATAQRQERVCTSQHQHGFLERRAQCAELRDSFVVVARIAAGDGREQLTGAGGAG